MIGSEVEMDHFCVEKVLGPLIGEVAEKNNINVKSISLETRKKVTYPSPSLPPPLFCIVFL
jgi:hypothetical protein